MSLNPNGSIPKTLNNFAQRLMIFTIWTDFNDNDSLVKKWKIIVKKYECIEWFLYNFKDKFKEDEDLDPSHARLISLKTLIVQIKEIQDGIFSLWNSSPAIEDPIEDRYGK